MKKDARIEIRCTQKEKNRILGLAKLYGYWSVSQFIVAAVTGIKAPKRKAKQK